MAYKSIIALAALAAAFVLPTTSALARGGHGGGGFHGGGFHGGFGFRGGHFGGFRANFFPPRRFFVGGPYYAGYYGSCWRWVDGYYGPHRVWACGYPYY